MLFYVICFHSTKTNKKEKAATKQEWNEKVYQMPIKKNMYVYSFQTIYKLITREINCVYC